MISIVSKCKNKIENLAWLIFLNSFWDVVVILSSLLFNLSNISSKEIGSELFRFFSFLLLLILLLLSLLSDDDVEDDDDASGWRIGVLLLSSFVFT